VFDHIAGPTKPIVGTVREKGLTLPVMPTLPVKV
jgi:hypothetical protein